MKQVIEEYRRSLSEAVNLDQQNIYFDLEQFSKFKQLNPEFLEWLDNPSDQIIEFMKGQTNYREPKVEWDDFVEYHEEAMAFMESTEAAMQEIYEMLSSKSH